MCKEYGLFLQGKRELYEVAYVISICYSTVAHGNYHGQLVASIVVWATVSTAVALLLQAV